MPSRGRTLLVLSTLTLLVIATAAGALFIGAADTTTQIITDIRAPRVALALIVGAGLGLAGALLQGSFRNPLADPGIVGVSGGAALGAVAIVALGAAYSSWLAAVGAVIGGALAMATVTWIARDRGRTEVVTLILGGVAVTAFASAVLSIIVVSSDLAGVRSTTFWTTGSLALATWPGVWATLPFVIAAALLAAVVSRRLDVLSMGDRAAYATGVDVERTRILALFAAVLATAAGVAVVGIIVFVGLVVPHAVRMLIGPRHVRVLIGSALVGALLVLLADTAARTVTAPVELPIGVVTAVIGAPVFVWLLRRARAQQGGWA
jgi:iron complex transport system permease protein